MAELPDWTPIEGVLPPSSDGKGRVVGVVASEEASSAGWAASAALDLARAWADRGQRVILVDAALQRPSLHEALGVANREGLTDAALYGASVGRISHPVEDGSFFVVTAGAPVADPCTVVRSERFHRIAEGATEAGALFLMYLRDGETETSAFLGSASDIVVLARPGDDPPSAVLEMQPLVRAVTGSGQRGERSVSPSLGATPSAAEALPAGRASGAEKRRSPAAPTVEPVGFGRLLILILAALLAAAGLGYVLTSVL
ncbi:MAG: hypothetical protein OEN56_13760 [Gemmatimonadota bacterium]|nr:hypothetical protein [Gemmatimonadota bacterium]MDH3424301.1 hypothetical protein [Gemmatimonadota bacterium]